MVRAEDPELAAPSLSLRDFLQVLKRRKTIALLTFAAVLGAVATLTLLTKPQYRATAQLLLPSDSKTSDSTAGDLLGPLYSPDTMQIETQIQLLASPLILNQTYKEASVPPGTVSLSVTRVNTANVVELNGVSGSKPDLEKFLTTLPKVYRDNRSNDRLREVSAQLKFAQKNYDQENRKLHDTEVALRNFNEKNGLVNADSEATSALDRAARSKADLASAQATISSLRAQITALQTELDGLSPSVNTPTVTTNPQLEILNNDLSALKAQRKQLSFLYKDGSDQMRKNQSDISAKQAQIARTPKTITNNSRTTNPAVADIAAKIADLSAQLSAQEAQAGVLAQQSAKLNASLSKYNDIALQQAALSRQLEASQLAVKAGGEEVRKLQVRSKALEASGAPVETLQTGDNAVKIAPQPSRNAVLGLFLGAILACAAALLQDSLDDRIRDEDEARGMIGAPVLGYFPLLPILDGQPILDIHNPDRLLLETFRALRSNVQFALVNSTGRKLQVTSTVPNEGKSYIVSNLAIAMALDGRRVILVDADLHRPSMHERFELKRQPGLTNVLVGEVALRAALQTTEVPGLRVLSAGALPPNPAELLNSPAMDAILRQLDQEADLIFFDSPPLLATSDSQLLSAKMDGVVFVMQMGSVARSGTLRAFELLKQAHANVIGIVFNKVTGSKSELSYEAYSGYYAFEQEAPEDRLLTGDAAPLSLKASADDRAKTADANGVHEDNGNSNGHGKAETFDALLSADETARRDEPAN